MCKYLFQTFQMQMLSPSSTMIAPADRLTQVLRITNPNKVSTNTESIPNFIS